MSELWDAYRLERDGKVRERLQMIIWSKEGAASREIGRRLNCPHSKVLYWIGRYDKEGLEGLKTKPRSGRPPKLSVDEVARIREKLESINCWRTKWVIDLIRKEAGLVYVQRHVVRLLHSWGFERITPRKRHRLADKQEQEKFLKKQGSYWVPCRKDGP